MENAQKDLLEWLDKVEGVLYRLRPQSVSLTLDLINEFRLLELTSAEKLLKSISVNMTIDSKRTQLLQAIRPIVSTINSLYNETKNQCESDYREAFQKQLDNLIKQNNLPKLFDPMIKKTKSYLDNWESPIEQHGLLLRKNGTFQTIEIFRSETKLAIELINKYLPICELETNIIGKELPQVHPKKTPTTETEHSTLSPDIDVFSNEQYVIFEYIEKKYTRDDKAKPTKYSNIYRFMKSESLINCTHDSYRDFIKKYRAVPFAKIIRVTFKYSDDIQPLLARILKQFNQQNN
jgi:hypothetical protein